METSKAKNCAHNLEKPVEERQFKQFVGLRNKGATCYLNSLIQAYYATPEFRQAIFDMQLCVDNITKKSNFVDNANKHSFLLGFQKLFVEMQELNVSHLSTEDVTKTFGWDQNDALQQQDIQEAIRVIFDVMEKALKGTPYQNKLLDNFKIETVDKIKCLKCGNSSERVNVQYDLMSQIKGQSCIEESLINIQNFEKLNGDNQYYCENCESKQDALKGTQIRKLPSILTISLMRFEFDMIKLQRNKLNDRFTFGLELDASIFCDQFEDQLKPQDSIYELYAVLIHKGGAHGGHYHSYVRDFSEKSDWVNPRARKESNQEEEIKQQENQNKQMEIESQGQEQQQNNNTNGKNGHNNNNNGSSMYKSLKRNTRRGQKGNDQYIEEEEFPIVVENQHLLQNWFDIDDETIRCISGDKIQKQFGNNSDKESAYILLYRKKTLPKLPLQIPQYFQEHINNINSIHFNERQNYEKEKNSIEVVFRSYENLDLKTFKFNENAEMNKTAKICQEQNTSELFQAMDLNEDYSLFEVAYCENQMIQIYQEISYSNEKKVSEVDLEHKSEVLYINKKENEIDYHKLQKYCGKENSPLILKIVKNGENKGEIIFHSHRLLRDLKQTLFHLYDVSPHRQYLKVMNAGVVTQISNHAQMDDSVVSNLGIFSQSTILLSELEDNEMIQEGQLEEDQRYIILELAKNLPKKYVINTKETLKQIKDHFISTLNLDPSLKWRFKNVDENKLYKEDEYEQSFKEILLEDNNNEEQEIRLFLEEGPIPTKDEIIITFRYFDENFQEDVSREIFATSNSTIKEIKDKACELLELSAQDYYVYKVDENEQPSTCIKREGQILNSTNLKKCTMFYLIAISQQDLGVLEQEYVLYYYPDDDEANSIYLGQQLLNKNSTVDEIKEIISFNEKLREVTSAANNNIPKKIEKDNIRLREVKRSHQLGSILKNSDKKFGKIIGGGVEALCVQIRDQKEQLEEDDIVLQVCKRQVDTQSYSDKQEFIFKCGKSPTINDLKRAIINQYNLNIIDTADIDIAKHYMNQFEWKEINTKTIQKYKETQLKALTKKKGKKKKGNNQKNNSNGNNSNAQNNNNTQNNNNNVDGSVNGSVHNGVNNNNDNMNGSVQNQQQQMQQQDNEQLLSDQQEDLKRMPYLLKDGDIIGYRLKSEDIDGKDDFQTESDKENKKIYQIKKKNKDQWQTANFDDDRGFFVNINFEDDNNNNNNEDEDNFNQEEKDDSGY